MTVESVFVAVRTDSRGLQGDDAGEVWTGHLAQSAVSSCLTSLSHSTSPLSDGFMSNHTGGFMSNHTGGLSGWIID